MSTVKNIGLICLILLISYMPIIGALYVKAYSSSPSSPSVFSLEGRTISKSDTEIRYQIQMDKDSINNTISLGIVSPPPLIYCDGTLLPGADISASQFEKNTNTIVNIPSKTNCSSLELVFKKQAGYPLFGQISGLAMISNQQDSINYKRIIDIFSRDIRIFLLIVAILYLFFNHYEKTISQKRLNEDPIERHSLSWALFLFSSSGFLEALFPQINSGILSQVNSYLSAVAHLAPGVDLLLSTFRTYKNKKIPLYLYYIIFSYILFSDERIIALSIPGIPLATFVLILSLLKKIPITMVFYSGLMLINYSKLLAFGTPQYLPHIHLVSLYVGALMFYNTITRIQRLGKITHSVHWQNSNQETISSSNKDSITQILEKIIEVTGLKRVSFLNLVQDSKSYQLYSITKNTKELAKEIKILESIPPVFAASIASNEAIWHEHSSSERSIRLRKNSTYLSFEGYYSVIPVKQNAQIIGAIAFTGYSDEKNDNLHDFYKTILESFIAYIEKTIASQTEKKNLVHHKGLNSAKLALQSFLGFYQDAKTLTGSLDALSKSIDCKFILFSRNHENHFSSLLSIGFEEKTATRANQLSVFDNKLNEHGPFPLSIRSKKPVFVNQVSILFDVLSKGTVEFLTMTNTGSLAVLPVKTGIDKDCSSEINFAIMAVSKNEYFFNAETQELFKNFTNSIEERNSLIEVSALAKSQNNTLASFVPQEVAALLINGKSTRLESVGFLACFDLIGSTKFVNENGDRKFLANMQKLTEHVKIHAEGLHCQIFTTNWDAIFIHSDSIENLVLLYELLNEAVNSIFDAPNGDRIKSRMCVTHGNTSRDFSESEGFKRWTIVGNAMAEVCKLESSIKPLGEGVFIPVTLHTISMNSAYYSLNFVEASTNGLTVLAYRKYFKLKEPKKAA